jgi:regulator of RNase E activity RraA
VDRGGVRDGAVAIGGVVIRAGDWIYADEDAVLVSPRRLTQDVGPDSNG